MAQNTRYDETVINNFLSYVNEQITCLGIPESNIANIDEPNIDFVMVSGMTLSGKGDRMVSIKNLVPVLGVLCCWE